MIIICLLLSAVLHGLTMSVLAPWQFAPIATHPNSGNAVLVSLLSQGEASLPLETSTDGNPGSSPGTNSPAALEFDPVMPLRTLSPPDFPGADDFTADAHQLELNPTPALLEPFAITVATLPVSPGVWAPIESSEQHMLESHIEDWQRKLPQWFTDGTNLRWRDMGREYRVSVENRLPGTTTDLDRVVVSVSTRVEGLELSTHMQFQRRAFSHFAQFVDRWNPEVILSRDVIEGPFHSNSTIHVESDHRGGPVINGLTTVAANVSMSQGGRRSKIFRGGLRTRTPRIPLPAHVTTLPTGLENPDLTAHVLERDATLLFKADGSYQWSYDDTPDVIRVRQLPDTPYVIRSKDKAELKVSGIVRGCVLVYSPVRLVLEGPLLYARDPRQFPDSPDYLGLVSDKTVDVAPPDITGEGDLQIQAAIYAKRIFRIRRYRAPYQGVLTIFGSLTAGSLSATEPRFNTRITFDSRLETHRPPHFPLTDGYRLERWNREWTVASVPRH